MDNVRGFVYLDDEDDVVAVDDDGGGAVDDGDDDDIVDDDVVMLMSFIAGFEEYSQDGEEIQNNPRRVAPPQS